MMSALLCITAQAQVADLAAAQQLSLRGKYAESEAAFLKLQQQLPLQATLGLVRSYYEQGKHDEAIHQLQQQLKLSPDSQALHAQRAEIALALGSPQTCSNHLQRAGDSVQARWLRAEFLLTTGNVDKACTAFSELADFYDREWGNILTARELHWLGLALAQHARLNGEPKRFRELTNSLYPRLLELEPNFWPAHHASGLLLLEKYNAADAEAAFQEGLKINPQAADLHVGIARLALAEFALDRTRRRLQRALKANPQHLEALHCKADMEFASLRPSAAFEALKQAQIINPYSTETLGRLAATHELLATPTDDKHQAALKTLLADIDTQETNTAKFYAAWAVALEHSRRYPQAGIRLRQAIADMPQLLGPRGKLGMIEMRLGHETEARRLLEESFARDPFNVRVKNQLEVLDLLDRYSTKETKHFIIRYDPTHDEALAQFAARHAERCYDELVETFDYNLPEKAVIEFFSADRGVSAQQWFGARMVGLPNIHTIAACSGNAVAMVSPTAGKKRRNWADILRHEIVHLVNLQQTDYAVPHWLTEGCAVWQEDRPRRTRWKKLLLNRVPRGEVFDLSTINMGFLRPRSGDDWQLAYCQAEIYVELIVKKHGEDGLRRLLAAYHDNLSGEAAFTTALGTTIEAIEEAYAEYLGHIMARLSAGEDLQEPVKLAEAEQRWAAAPDNLQLGAELALVRLRRGDYPGAGRLAQQVLDKQPDQPLAGLVKARLLMRIGSDTQATELLAQLVESDSVEPEAIKLLAGLKLRQEKLTQARRLYLLGAEKRPDDLQWTRALAVVAIRMQDTAELKKLLERIAQAEPKNLVARRKLLELAKQDQNEQATQRWAEEVLHVDPQDFLARDALKLPEPSQN